MVVWHDKTEQENREHVEEDDSVEGELDGAWNRLSWVLCFTNCHTDEFSAQVRENSCDHGSPESVKLACSTGIDIGLEGTWILIVSETGAVAVWSTSEHNDKREQDQAADNQYLDRREPELKFAKPFDANVVDRDDYDQEDGDEHAGIDFARWNPVLNDERCSGELIGRDDDVFKPVCL